MERAFFFLAFSLSTVESFSINKEFLVLGIHMGLSIWFFVGCLVMEFGLIHFILINGSYVSSNSRRQI